MTCRFNLESLPKFDFCLRYYFTDFDELLIGRNFFSGRGSGLFVLSGHIERLCDHVVLGFLSVVRKLKGSSDAPQNSIPGCFSPHNAFGNLLRLLLCSVF